MATRLIGQGAELPDLDLDVGLEPPLYLATSSLVGIRLWTRRDRSAIERWPRVELPNHWHFTGESSGSRISFAIDELPRSQLVGRVTLRDITEEQARIGIYLHPDRYGQGLGTSAMLALQRHLFRSGMHRLVLDVAGDNTRAVRSYLRAGWHVCGTVQRACFTYYEMEVRP